MKKLIAVLGVCLMASIAIGAETEKLTMVKPETTVTIKMSMTIAGDKLVASLTVVAPENSAGVLTVKWTAPTPSADQTKAGKFCTDSTIDLKYMGPRWRTRANRTVYRDEFDCAGTWKAVVADEQGNVLRSLEFDVPARKK